MPRAAASAVPLPIASTWVVAERGDESHSYRQAGGAGQHSGSRLAECAAQGELGGGPPLQGPGDAAIDQVDDEDRQYYVCHPSRPPGAQPRGQAAGRQAQDPERHGDAAEVQHDAGHREVNEPAHPPWSPWPVCGHRVAHQPIIGCSREGSLQVRLTYSASASRGGRLGTPLPPAQSIPSARASSLRRPVPWSADTAMPPCRRAIASPSPSPRRSIWLKTSSAAPRCRCPAARGGRPRCAARSQAPPRRRHGGNVVTGNPQSLRTPRSRRGIRPSVPWIGRLPPRLFPAPAMRTTVVQRVATLSTMRISLLRNTTRSTDATPSHSFPNSYTQAAT